MSPQGEKGTGATLRIPFNADKEIAKLPRNVQGDVMIFMREFRDNPNHPKLRLKILHETKKGPRLYSARVTIEYRAIMARAAGNDYLLLTVKHRKDAYEKLDRYSYAINRVTGGIEYVNLETVEEGLAEAHRETPPAQPPAAAQPEAAAQPAAGPLFASFTDEQLTELGVAEALLPVIRKITTEDELLSLVELAPQITREVLLELHGGKSPEEVMETVTRPVAADGPVDTEDYQAALARPATQVTTDDEALRIVLADSFQRWLTYLHPTQASLVTRHYTGPARVSGGPGTGKTIVALHRVKHLVERCLEEETGSQGSGSGSAAPVLLTTFNKNLAADLRARLLLLGGRELVDRVDVTNVDELASRVTREAESGNQGNGPKRRIADNDVPKEWKAFLQEIGETRWDHEFLAEEWSQVILGQAINSRADYFQARRAGRGRKISRADRHEIWQLVERFTKRLDKENKESFQQVAERAARLEMERDAQLRQTRENGEPGGGRLRHRYRHVVVDEAQDLHAAHWKMLRAMVAPGPNDLFIVGDTHQRVYQNRVSLGSLGINIRGRRSTRLTLSYRTTREILTSALGLLSGETYDDLDDGTDNLSGYRSVLFGTHPHLEGFTNEDEELDAVASQVQGWLDGERSTRPSSVAICVPTGKQVEAVTRRLTDAGIQSVEVGPQGPAHNDGVHVGTLQRFKGLEYQRMIIAGATDGLLPLRSIRRFEDSDPVRYRRERQRARSMLFVAATRARDDLVIFWHGTPSPFLPVPQR